MSSGSERAVSITTGTVLRSLIRRQTLTPSRPGSMMSRSAMSGSSRSNSANPAVPSAADRTSNPCRSSTSVAVSRIVGSSSTSSTRAI